MVSHPPATTASQFKDPHLMVNLVVLPNVQPWTWCTEEEKEEEEVDCCFCIIRICHFLEIYLQRTDIFVCYTWVDGCSVHYCNTSIFYIESIFIMNNIKYSVIVKSLNQVSAYTFAINPISFSRSTRRRKCTTSMQKNPKFAVLQRPHWLTLPSWWCHTHTRTHTHTHTHTTSFHHHRMKTI